MEKKLIFLDIDGTILENSAEGIHEAVRRGLAKARKNGHQVFICTGRSRSTLPDFLKVLELDGIISSAGSDIWIGEKNIYRVSQDAGLLKKACEFMERLGAVYMLEGFEHTYIPSNMMDMDSENGLSSAENPELARWRSFLRRRKNARRVEEWDPETAPIPKLSFILHRKEDIETVQRAFQDDFYVVFFNTEGQDTYNGELISRNVNKGTAIHRTAEYLGVDIRDTIAFGDSMNDYHMIRAAGCGVVMENGEEELKVIADRICESVHEDGVIRELERMGVIEAEKTI